MNLDGLKTPDLDYPTGGDADHHLVLFELFLKATAITAPPSIIDLTHHDFDNDDPVLLEG
jgi:hypothetical protein